MPRTVMIGFRTTRRAHRAGSYSKIGEGSVVYRGRIEADRGGGGSGGGTRGDDRGSVDILAPANPRGGSEARARCWRLAALGLLDSPRLGHAEPATPSGTQPSTRSFMQTCRTCRRRCAGSPRRYGGRRVCKKHQHGHMMRATSQHRRTWTNTIKRD